MGEAEPSEAIEFVWGRKGSRGGLNKGCQFYKSFRYDGVEYLLYDSVYLYKDGERDPYIGKIIKIWEHHNRSRKVKVLWFFRPSEITNYIGDAEVAENELFLASGDGVGLTNINPLVISEVVLFPSLPFYGCNQSLVSLFIHFIID